MDGQQDNLIQSKVNASVEKLEIIKNEMYYPALTALVNAVYLYKQKDTKEEMLSFLKCFNELYLRVQNNLNGNFSVEAKEIWQFISNINYEDYSNDAVRRKVIGRIDRFNDILRECGLDNMSEEQSELFFFNDGEDEHVRNDTDMVSKTV